MPQIELNITDKMTLHDLYIWLLGDFNLLSIIGIDQLGRRVILGIRSLISFHILFFIALRSYKYLLFLKSKVMSHLDDFEVKNGISTIQIQSHYHRLYSFIKDSLSNFCDSFSRYWIGTNGQLGNKSIHNFNSILSKYPSMISVNSITESCQNRYVCIRNNNIVVPINFCNRS